MRPSIGARLVCTSKIDRKIRIRLDLFFRISFSSTSTLSVTVPSAAATMRFGSAGVARSGSRKNASVEKINNRKSSDNHGVRNQLAIARRTRTAKIQRASRKVWARIKRPHFPIPKWPGQVKERAVNWQMAPEDYRQQDRGPRPGGSVHKERNR